MTKVLLAPAHLEELEGEYREIMKRGGFEFVFPGVGRQMIEPELAKTLPGCKASIAGSEPYTRAILQNNPQLKVIARVGVGFDAVDIPAATEFGVAVCIAPGTNQDSVAEHTMLLILGCARTIMTQHNGVAAGAWPRNANVPIRGQTLGILGLGRIGKAVALRGLAFHMPVLAYEPFPDQAFVNQHGIKLVDMETLFRQSDFLSIHAPMSAESRHLVNAKTLAWMKPTAYLINTARGGLVNENDLYAALTQGKLAGAGLDVFNDEPPVGCPLLKLDNVVMTAHTAGVDWKSRDDMAVSAAQAIVDISQGKWPAEKIVNPEVKAKFRWA